MSEPEINKNSLVMFRGRVNKFPMRVQAVRVNADGSRNIKVDDKWWGQSVFIPLKTWEEQRSQIDGSPRPHQ